MILYLVSFSSFIASLQYPFFFLVNILFIPLVLKDRDSQSRPLLVFILLSFSLLSILLTYSCVDVFDIYKDVTHYYDNYLRSYIENAPVFRYGKGAEITFPFFNYLLTIFYRDSLDPQSYLFVVSLFLQIIQLLSYRLSRFYHNFSWLGYIFILCLPFYGIGFHLLRTYFAFSLMFSGIFLWERRISLKFIVSILLISAACLCHFTVPLYFASSFILYFFCKYILSPKFTILTSLLSYLLLCSVVIFPFLFPQIISTLSSLVSTVDIYLLQDKLVGYNSTRQGITGSYDFKSLVFSFIPFFLFPEKTLALFRMNSSGIAFFSRRTFTSFSILGFSILWLYLLYLCLIVQFSNPLQFLSLRLLSPFLIMLGPFSIFIASLIYKKGVNQYISVRRFFPAWSAAFALVLCIRNFISIDPGIYNSSFLVRLHVLFSATPF